jgi:YbbR domain-containing protein
LISYPIEFVFEEDSVVVMDPLPKVVKIDVTSGGWNLFRRTLLLSVEPFQVELDNPSEVLFLTRSFLMPIIADQLEGLTINYVVSDTLPVNIERKVSKMVTLKVDSINLPLASRYRLTTSIDIDPPQVALIGPESIINSFENEYYIMPDIGRINEDVVEQVDIPVPFENIMSSNPEIVKVSFDVDRFEKGRISIPLELLNFPEDSLMTLRDSAVMISYTFQQSLGDDYLVNDFGITLDYNMLEDDSTIIPMLIYAPESALELTLTPLAIQLLFDE